MEVLGLYHRCPGQAVAGEIERTDWYQEQKHDDGWSGSLKLAAVVCY